MYSRSEKLSGTGKFENYYQIVYGFAFLAAVYAYFIQRYFEPEQYEQWVLYSLYLSGAVFLWSAFIRWSWDKLVALIAAAVFIFFMPSAHYLVESNSDFAILSFFLLSASVDPKQSNLMSMIFYGKMALAIGVLAFYIAGKIPDLTFVRHGKDLIRHSYGFMHPNSLSMFMVSLLYDFSLMSKKSLRGADILWMLLLGLLTYAVTNSHTGFLLFLVIAIASVFKEFLSKWTVPGAVIFAGVVAIFIFGTSIATLYNENSQFSLFLNSVLTRRPLNGHTYIQEYGFSSFPREIASLYYPNGQHMYNDNFYVDSLLRQGFIVYLLFPITVGFQMLNKRFSLYHAFLILTTFGTAVIEQYGVSICICSILLLNYFGKTKQSN